MCKSSRPPLAEEGEMAYDTGLGETGEEPNFAVIFDNQTVSPVN